MAAVLGAHNRCIQFNKDEALALPTGGCCKIALRTQQVCAHESGITKTVDPLAGSYYVEYLTDKIEDESKQVFEKN